MFRTGLLLFFIGFTLALAAGILTMLMAASGIGGEGPVRVSGGGCVLIFFIPICFGVGEAALPLMIIAVVLTVVLALLGLVGLRRVRVET